MINGINFLAFRFRTPSVQYPSAIQFQMIEIGRFFLYIHLNKKLKRNAYWSLWLRHFKWLGQEPTLHIRTSFIVKEIVFLGMEKSRLLLGYKRIPCLSFPLSFYTSCQDLEQMVHSFRHLSTTKQRRKIMFCKYTQKTLEAIV
jgi:hypothetical protein